MKALFVHDHIFVRWEGHVYSPGRLPYSAWSRYLEHFDELVVVARYKDALSAREVAAMQVADGKGVTFDNVPLLRGFSRLRFSGSLAKAKVAENMSHAQVVIARVPSEMGFVACGVANSLAKPLAVEVVASAWHSMRYHGSLAGKLYAPVFELRTRKAVLKADQALYVTREYLQSRYPCRGVSAAASNVVVKPADDVAIRNRLDRVRHVTRTWSLGFVGSLEARHKGLDTALQALRLVADAGMDARLSVVGEGDVAVWRAMAQSLAVSDRVDFLGGLPGSAAVQSWMDGIDVYLHPSKAEGLPRSLIEAMSRGCLALGSSAGGIPELLSETCLHAPGDARRLAALVTGLAAMAGSARESMARRNFDVAGEYSADRMDLVRSGFYIELRNRASFTPGVQPLVPSGIPGA